jgi:hypothetical protein
MRAVIVVDDAALVQPAAAGVNLAGEPVLFG